MILELPKQFDGVGEVKGAYFSQISHEDGVYLYGVRGSTPAETRFEVFKRKVVPVCIDFANRVYSEDEFKVSYPKSDDFGVWAWTYKSLQEAQKKFHSFIM